MQFEVSTFNLQKMLNRAAFFTALRLAQEFAVQEFQGSCGAIVIAPQVTHTGY